MIIATTTSDATNRPPVHRVLCVAYTIDSRAHRCVAQYRSFGNRCDHFAIFTNASRDDGDIMARQLGGTTNDSDAERISVHVVAVPGGDTYTNVWQKMRAIRAHLSQWPSFAAYEYVVFGGDDYYLNMDNLRLVLSQFGHRQAPLYLGYDLIDRGTTRIRFAQGGAYVLNQRALRFAIEADTRFACAQNVTTLVEDQLLSWCLRKHYGVEPVSPTDEFGEPLFNMLNPARVQAVAMTHGPHQRDVFRQWYRATNWSDLRSVSSPLLQTSTPSLMSPMRPQPLNDLDDPPMNRSAAWRAANVAHPFDECFVTRTNDACAPGFGDLATPQSYLAPRWGLNAVSYRSASLHYMSPDDMTFMESDAA